MHWLAKCYLDFEGLCSSHIGESFKTGGLSSLKINSLCFPTADQHFINSLVKTTKPISPSSCLFSLNISGFVGDI